MKDVGLLVLRLGIGLIFLKHGFPKIAGGPEMWGKLGGAMGTIGIAFWPVFWGFMAAVAEFVGAILLIGGVFFRIACALMAFTMLVAVAMHLKQPDANFSVYSHALSMGVVFVGLLVAGAGRFSIGDKLSAPWLK